ncbi:Substrate-specific component BioY of biotin ECF transporter [hydrothermal vent metagenome]|uniref:Substrate-specific component BioY of biotin ECF transporter n=1 Tax=hydrothermal vent metagenome TaxID=652676 RepID=A0A3B0TRT5_9ZZZZ
MATDLANSPQPMIATLVPEHGAARLASQIMLAVAGSIVLWVSAKTQVPFYPVPMTLQTLALLVIAATYGFRLSMVTVLLYLAEGAFGLPVFSATPERGIGLLYMAGPTAGYLVGFVVATGLVGWFADRGANRSSLRLFFVMLAAALSVLAIGGAYLSIIVGAQSAWTFGVMPFLLGDLVKVAIAALLVPAAAGLLRR